MKSPRFILSGGGTGGHIYPAIAIANELKAQFPEAQFLFVGAMDKMEMQKVPQAGYNIRGLWIAGLQRRLTFDNTLFPVKLLTSLLKARRILAEFKPDVVIGTGGFASGPLLQVASIAGVPSVIQEQNSYPGITNKLLSRKANKICVAYEGLQRFFPKEKLVFTGNPVRQDLIDLTGKREEAVAYFGLDPHKKTLLVLGGSLGSRRINELIAKEIVNITAQDIQVIWQCGKLYFEQYAGFNEKHNIQVFAFIDHMDLVYAAADVVVSRAGASSVSELCIVGKPVIFIPSPNVAEDHQTRNAQAVVAEGGAILIRESELDTQFMGIFNKLLADGNLRAQLADRISKLAKVNATKDIVSEIVKLLKK